MNNIDKLLIIGIVLVIVYYIYEVLNVNIPELPIVTETPKKTQAIDLLPVPANILAAKNPNVIKLTQL